MTCRSTSPPARELGMATVHHVEAGQTIGELQRLLAVELA